MFDLTKDKLITPDDLADILQISRPTVYRLIEKRAIPFYKVGGSVRFCQQDIQDYLNKSLVNEIK